MDKWITRVVLIGALFLASWIVMLAVPFVTGVTIGFWPVVVGLWVTKFTLSYLVLGIGVAVQASVDSLAESAREKTDDPNRG